MESSSNPFNSFYAVRDINVIQSESCKSEEFALITVNVYILVNIILLFNSFPFSTCSVLFCSCSLRIPIDKSQWYVYLRTFSCETKVLSLLEIFIIYMY